MASLGFRTVNEMVGQADKLKRRDNITHWKYKHLDVSPIINKEFAEPTTGLYNKISQNHNLEHVLDWKMIEIAQPALKSKQKCTGSFEIINTDRAVGTMISNEVSKIYKGTGLPNDTIHFNYKGSAGQSFGAFGAPGLTLELEGEANDYFGKGLSGARLVVYPPKEAKFKAEENIIIGNVALYGATSGQAFIRGMAGERFCVRNSGGTAVVEGVGDHGCEYMTGGIAVILGNTGRNFAAGMSGGVAYVFDPKKEFPKNCNTEMVELESLMEEDLDVVLDLISKQKEYTKSKLATEIINNWEELKGHFIKVMPSDYKKVLEERKIKGIVRVTS
jgi:glutamate synthase (NADPH/NADH) large chain